MLLFGSIFLLLVSEEKEICEGGIEEERMFSSDGDKVQPLLPRVPAPPEGSRLFVSPGYGVVALHRKQVQRHPAQRWLG